MPKIIVAFAESDTGHPDPRRIRRAIAALFDTDVENVKTYTFAPEDETAAMDQMTSDLDALTEHLGY